jgi:peptide/nickel transport system ATP-binding protein
MDTLLPIQDRGGPAQPLLLATGLRKHFPVAGGLFGRTTKVVRAVDDLTLSVAKGETLGVVGESGCGKSTVARLLIRLLKPDKGTMVLDGDPVDEPHGITVNELRRQVQMVFQDSYASLNPRLTAADSIAFGPRVHGMAAAASRDLARELLRKVGLDPTLFAGRYPHELSGGQRQRVNIARALALSPRLLLLDEAVSALDKSVEAQVLNLLCDLKAELGLTYVFISHDLSVVRYMSDRVMVMYLGKVVEIGAVDEIYADRRCRRSIPIAVPNRRRSPAIRPTRSTRRRDAASIRAVPSPRSPVGGSNRACVRPAIVVRLPAT